MDTYSGKRCARGIMASRKGYNTSSKSAAIERDQHAQFCNRIGCSGRIKYGQNTKIGGSDKAKCSKPDEITASSSRSSSSSSLMTTQKKPQLDTKRKLSSQSRFDPSESRESMKKSGKVAMTEIGSSSVSSNVGPRKIFHQKSGLVSVVSKSPAIGPFNSSNGIRNNSESNVVPPSCSSPGTKSFGKNVMKRETSLLSRGRKTNSGISISDSGQSSSVSGDSNSGWSRRSMNVNTRMRLSSRQNGRNNDNESGFNTRGQSSSRQFSGNISSSGSRSYNSLSSSNSDNNPSARMPFTSSDPSFTHLMNHRNGIAEVLLALERIEQDEDLTHEQVLALETSLFLSGLNLYDQHRDMRLDIDNMSYEDLLALEERMGTVSTALPEEALSKCIRRGIYKAVPLQVRITGYGDDGDDTKCSICQEEYVIGDEIGKLVECEHGYHETCINQWLRVKNWCPICKASVANPSKSSSS